MKYFTLKTSVFLIPILFLFTGCSKKGGDLPPKKMDPGVTITSIDVHTGVFTTLVTISGKGFGSTIAENKAFFNGKAVERYNYESPTKLQVYVPLGAGTGPVTITVNGVTATGPIFTYQTTPVITTFAGGSIISNYSDGLGPDAAFFQPDGLAIDDAGNLYVADEYNNRIRKITPQGLVSTLAGNGNKATVDGTGKDASFAVPKAICVDKAGNVYVTDYESSAIRKITPEGKVTTLSAPNSSSNAPLSNPSGIAVDETGNLFIADHGDGTLKELTPDGKITTIANLASKGMSTEALTIDKKGNIYFLSNNGVYERQKDGAIVFIAGGNMSDSDGTGSEAGFNSWALTLNAEGNIIVSDPGNQRIRMVTPAGVVTTLAGKLPSGISGDGPAEQLIVTPLGIAVDKNGIIYFVEGNLIKKISVL